MYCNTPPTQTHPRASVLLKAIVLSICHRLRLPPLRFLPSRLWALICVPLLLSDDFLSIRPTPFGHLRAEFYIPNYQPFMNIARPFCKSRFNTYILRAGTPGGETMIRFEINKRILIDPIEFIFLSVKNAALII